MNSGLSARGGKSNLPPSNDDGPQAIAAAQLQSFMMASHLATSTNIFIIRFPSAVLHMRSETVAISRWRKVRFKLQGIVRKRRAPHDRGRYWEVQVSTAAHRLSR